MNLDELNELVKALSLSSKEPESKIFDYIAESAKSRYGSISSKEERNIIDKIKNKLIIGLYEISDHSLVKRTTDFKTKFNLDKLDMDYIEKAVNELSEEGLIEGDENHIKLTEKGILKARQLLNI